MPKGRAWPRTPRPDGCVRKEMTASPKRCFLNSLTGTAFGERSCYVTVELVVVVVVVVVRVCVCVSVIYVCMYVCMYVCLYVCY